MRTVTTLEIANNVRMGLQQGEITSFGTDKEQRQLLYAINRAQSRMFEKGSCFWNEYQGSIIITSAKRSVPLTPENYNYATMTRDFSTNPVTNCSVTLYQKLSFDDTTSMAKLTASSSTASLTVPSVTGANNGSITASVWLATGDSSVPTNSAVTLTLKDKAGGQQVSTTVYPSSTPNRFAITGPYTGDSTGVDLVVSWAGSGSILYIDAAQIEKGDYASEYIDNPTSDKLIRTSFVAADRINDVFKYCAGTYPLWYDAFFLDSTLMPNDHSAYPNSLGTTLVSLQGGQLNLVNATPPTHISYRGKAIPKTLTGVAGETITIPDPWVWVLIEGAKAYIQEAMYDIGANNDAASAVAMFENKIDAMLENSILFPSYYTMSVMKPRNHA